VKLWGVGRPKVARRGGGAGRRRCSAISRMRKGTALARWSAWALRPAGQTGPKDRGNSFWNENRNFGICQGFENLHKEI
jgi:hypothetical protein